MPLIWGGYQGDFSLRNTWPRGLCLARFPHPWGKFSTLLQPFYNLPGWPGVLPQGQADDMCIIWECGGALPLVEIWSHEFVNKLVEWEAFIDSVWRECTQLKDEFLFEIFAAFCVPVVWGQPANSHVVVGVIGKIKMARNWFGRICVVFSTSRRRSRKRSANLLPVSPM